MNENRLKTTWDTSHNSTKEDWADWIRTFSFEFLAQSPYPALRACLSVAQVYSIYIDILVDHMFLVAQFSLIITITIIIAGVLSAGQSIVQHGVHIMLERDAGVVPGAVGDSIGAVDDGSVHAS